MSSSHSHLPPECFKTATLGSFECTSGTLLVTDPCYSKMSIETGTIAVVLNASQGTWWAFAKRSLKYPERVANLLIIHENIEEHELFMERYDTQGYWGVGVDTGQAGFFDRDKYPQSDHTGDFEDKSTFYGMCCFITLKTLHKAGIIAASPTCGFGVVSSAGYGDGMYDLYTARNANKELIAARLDFLVEEI